MLATRYETIVVEELNVAGIMKNHNLAASIGDQGFGQVRWMLGYKTTWNGGRLLLAERFYPSSKTCSGCGTVKDKLALSERTYQCDNYGLVLDRDVNAARNLLKLAVNGSESINARGAVIRPSMAGQVVVKREPGTQQWDKTGTAVWQRAATE
jgi:putative transposase